MQMNNIILDKFNAGEPCLGTFTHLLSPTALRAMGKTGLDYVIVDLPPMMAVSDALVVSKYLDGIVVVVRQNVCDKKSLAETVRQLRFSQAKLLGFVVSDSDTKRKKYRKKYYGSEYYRSQGE